jgi:hypothetical protein
MRVRFVIEDIILIPAIVTDEIKKTKRIVRLVDDTEIDSLGNTEKEIKELILRYNKQEKKEGREGYRKLLRIIDEEKLKKCPTELLWDTYPRQELQGECCNCGYKFVDFFNRGNQQKENFKYCHGFGHSRAKDFDRIIVFECPKCFVKSQFHCNENWLELYGEWIVDKSIFIEKKEQAERGERG